MNIWGNIFRGLGGWSCLNALLQAGKAIA